MKNRLKQENGITLIALVITIIVLLILAGISIATLTGENGLLAKTNIAKEQTEIVDAKEQAKIDITVEIAERIEAGRSTDLSDSDIRQILTGKEYVSKEEGQPGENSFKTRKSGYEISYADLYNSSTGKQPPIPDEFYPVGGSIEEGFVISDVKGDNLDNSLHGNQFVWVPVENFNDFKRVRGYVNGNLESCTFTTEGLTSGKYYEPKGDGIKDTTEVEKMYKSVKDNGGFYIGRYEAGNDGNANVIVQKNATVYNNIKWETSMTDGTEGAVGAVEKARNFTNGKPYDGKVTSTLIYGVQWDATMQFMDSKYRTGECGEDSYVRNSKGKGWYSIKEETKKGPTETGYYEYKHIYDMAGNVLEWTMEAYDTSVRVSRGGSYNRYGSDIPASIRIGYSDHSDVAIGFRLALYL